MSSENITERKTQNLIIAFYEGFMKEWGDYSEDKRHILFGRSLYCNYKMSYYQGYTTGLQRNTKGIYHRIEKENKKVTQGYFKHGQSSFENEYTIVDLMHINND